MRDGGVEPCDWSEPTIEQIPDGEGPRDNVECVSECTPTEWTESGQTTEYGHLLANMTTCEPSDCVISEGCSPTSQPPDPNLTLNQSDFKYKVTWYVDCSGVIADPNYQTNIASCEDDPVETCVQSVAWSAPDMNDLRYWIDCISNCSIYGCLSDEIEAWYGTPPFTSGLPPNTTDICPP